MLEINNRKPKYVRNENRSYYYYRTELFPEKTGRSAELSDNYPCTNKPALKETKDEDCPTILQLEKHFRNSTFCLTNYLKWSFEYTTKEPMMLLTVSMVRWHFQSYHAKFTERGRSCEQRATENVTKIGCALFVLSRHDPSQPAQRYANQNCQCYRKYC